MIPVLLLALATAPERVPATPLAPDEAARRDALARYGVGLLRDAADRPADAAKQLEAAAKSAPESPAPLRPLVKVYTDLGRDAAAIRTARKVLELDPADADTGHALAKLLFDGKRFADAVVVLKPAAESPRLADRPAKRLGILRDLDRSAQLAGDFASAADACRTAITLTETARESLLKSGVFPTATDLDREAAEFHERLGKALTARNQFADAATAFAKAATLFAEKANDPTAAARLNWNLSGTLAEKGDAATALDHLKKFLALKPSGTAPYERLVELMSKLGRDKEVAPLLARLAADNPANPGISWVQAYALSKTDPAAADRAFRELLARTSDPAAFRLAVRRQSDTPRPGELLALVDSLLKSAKSKGADDDESPSKPAADAAAVARARAIVDAVKADPNAAKMLVRHLPNIRPAGSIGRETWDFLAALAERDGKLQDAEDALRNATQANPVNREAALQLLEILAKQRKWAKLRAECEALIAGSPRGRSLMVDVYLATALAELGGPANALEAVKIANELADNVQATGQLWASLQKPRILKLLGKHADAVSACEQLLKQYPKPADARRIRVTLADSLNGQKDYAKAEAELRAVLEDDPDDLLVLNNLGYNLADQGRKLEEAEAMVRRAIELDAAERLRNGNAEAESGVYLDSLGWVLFRRGKLADARTVLEKATTLPDSATDAVVWDHLGDVAFRQGEKDRAKTAWIKAIELYANSHTGRQDGRRDETMRKLKRLP